jgi:hypothetical protein
MTATSRTEPELPSLQRVESSIVLLRGQRVLLDVDLAILYGVSTRALVQAIRRNKARFPRDFMVRLTRREFARLRLGSAMANAWGGRRHAVHALTEQGVAMLSSVLRSERAVLVNIEIMRVFVRLRRLLISHEDLAVKLAELESRYDGQFRTVFEALRELMENEESPPGRIGFQGPGQEEPPT